MTYVTDIHTHLLPDVDDGARTYEESIQEISLLVDQKVNTIFCTPHSNAASSKKIRFMFDALKRKVNYIYPNVGLYLGMEIYISPRYLYDILQKLDNHQLLTLNNTNYILIEFNPNISYADFIKSITYLCHTTYKPIIAHTERIKMITNDLVKWAKYNGCKIQVNYYSLYNEPNPNIRFRAHELIREKLVDFMGSDGHRIDHRSPKIKKGIQYVIDKCNPKYANDILYNNTQRYLL